MKAMMVDAKNYSIADVSGNTIANMEDSKLVLADGQDGEENGIFQMKPIGITMSGDGKLVPDQKDDTKAVVYMPAGQEQRIVKDPETEVLSVKAMDQDVTISAETKGEGISLDVDASTRNVTAKLEDDAKLEITGQQGDTFNVTKVVSDGITEHTLSVSGYVTSDDMERKIPEVSVSGNTVSGAHVEITDIEEFEKNVCTHPHCVVLHSKDATCTQKGYTGDVYCPDCDTLIDPGKDIPMSGHKPAAAVHEHVIAATAEKDGSYDEVVYCSECHTQLSRTKKTTPKTGVIKEPDDVGGKPQDKQTGQEEQKNPVPAAKNTKLQDAKSGAGYVVTNDAAGTAQVKLSDTKNIRSKKYTVPKTVEIDGVTYQITEIADNAFKKNQTLEQVTIGNNVVKIGKNAFAGAKKLKKAVIKGSVKSIGNNAFKGCKKLKTLKLSKGVETIGNSAFEGCISLQNITIPASVKKIGKKAFFGCKKLSKIKILTTSLSKKSVGAKAFASVSTKAAVSVPKNKRSAYGTLLKKKGLPKSAKVK